MIRRNSGRSGAGARSGRALAAVLAVAIALILSGCHYGYPHACDNHGGIRTVLKSVYFCRDGRHVGAGWLLLHHREVAP